MRIFRPESGVLACGHTGPGRLVEPKVLTDEVLAFLGLATS